MNLRDSCSLPGSVLRALVLLAIIYTTTSAVADAPPRVNHQTKLSIVQTDATITLAHGDKTILVYNKQPPTVPEGIDPVYSRSGFLHPVITPGNHTVTAVYPSDHAHQNGIFTAWVRTRWRDRKIDFWNVAAKTGRVQHDAVLSTFNNEHNAGFVVALRHRAVKGEPIDVLKETWRVAALPTDGGYYCLELQSTQENMTDHPLIIQKYHYGGFAVRGPMPWLSRQENPKQPALHAKSSEGCQIFNSLGSQRDLGNHQPTDWVCMAGPAGTSAASITMIPGESNFRSPQTARLHPSKPYFCFAPCITQGFSISPGQPFESTYRFIVADGEPSPQWIEQTIERHWPAADSE